MELFSAYLYPPPVKKIVKTAYFRGVMFVHAIDAKGRNLILTYNLIRDDYDDLLEQKDIAKYFQEKIRHVHPTCQPKIYPRGWR